jgi:dTDP-glucose 4,6-dehydratase
VQDNARILVTGGAGFIGSHYARALLAGAYPGCEHARVTVLDKLTYAGNLANLGEVAGRFDFVKGDIGDAGLLARLLPGHDAVVNFAAETHVDRSIAGASEFVTSNVTGVQVLLDACLAAGVRRVVHVSTDEVYGSIAEGSWTEDAPLDPNSPYAAAKAGGDLLVQAFARTHGLNVSITRCCNNYGPGQYPEKVIPLFATNLLGRVYHIDGGTELTNLELTEAILAACGASWSQVVPFQDRKGHDRRYSLDDSLLRSMGYLPRVPFAHGLKETIAWYANNRTWWEPLPRPTPPQRKA